MTDVNLIELRAGDAAQHHKSPSACLEAQGYEFDHTQTNNIID